MRLSGFRADVSRLVVPALLCLLMFSLPSWGASTTVVISQIYTAGGNSGATYNADYVELFNLGSANVNLNGYALQYIAATGTSGTVITLPSGITLTPGQRYLIQGTPSTTAGAALPSTADYTASGLAAGAAAGRIYLTSSTTALSGTCPTANVVDYVGYGSTAACYEGSKYAPAPSTTLADVRTNPCTDTDDNSADFATATPTPRNFTSTPTPCSTSLAMAVTAAASPSTVTLGNSVLFTGVVTPATGPASTGITVTANLSALGGSSSAAFHDDGMNGDATANDGTHSFSLPIANSVSTGNYTVTVKAADAQLRSASSTVSLTVNPASGKIAIHTIQGSTPGTSTYNGVSVTVSGIVTGIKSTGFFLQARDADADTDPNTSEGIFVFTGTGNVPTAAVLSNELSLTGTVNVYTGSSTVLPNVEITSPTAIQTLSTGNTMPTAITLTTTLPSSNGGIYQLYRRQSMRVAVPSLTTTQGTDGIFTESTETYVSNGVFWGTVTGVTRPMREAGLEVLDSFTASQASTISRFDDNPEVFQVDSQSMTGRASAGLDLTSNTVLSGVTGIVDFASGTQTVLLDASDKPTVSGAAATTAAAASSASQVSVGELNMERFYNDVKDTAGATVITTDAYTRRLQKASLAVRNVFGAPDIMAMEEVENLDTLTKLAAQISTDAVAAKQTDPGYMPYLQLGNDTSGISVGFLVKPAKVNVVSVTQFGKTDTYTNAGGTQATLNDRPPLVLQAGLKRTGTTDYPLTVIVNHLRSLNNVTDNTTSGASIRLKREAQAEYLAKLIQGYQSGGGHVISVGDYNAFEFNDGLVDSMGVIRGTPAPASQDVVAGASGLVSPALVDLLSTDASNGTYTYVFAGNAQSITHFIVTQDLASITKVVPVHLNADFPVVDRNDATTPNRTSDHDGEIGYITVPVPGSSLGLSSASLTFGSTVVGATSSTQSVTVTNSGTAAISISKIVASTNFSQANTCGTSLAGGGTCKIDISFAPTASGTLYGTVTLTDSDVTGMQTISLTGVGAGTAATVALSASANSVVSGTSVTFTATLTGNSASTPGGQVNFLDGQTQIGSASTTAGVAKFSTSALSVTNHTITAVFGGDSVYPTASSNAVTVAVTAPPTPDFNFSLTSTSLTLTRQVPTKSTTLNLSMTNGFSSQVSFACSGAPAFTTCSFSPAALYASGSTTLTVTAYTGTGALHREFFGGHGEIVLALLGLPVVLIAGRKRKLLARSVISAAGLLLCATALLTGCGKGTSTASTAGQNTPTGTSTVTITATGGGVSHTGTVTLIVQ